MAFLLQDLLTASAARAPEATAIISGGERHSYRALLEAAQSVGCALRRRGLARGDRVVIWAENGLPAAAGIFGALLAGGVFVVTHSLAKPGRVASILADCTPRFLVASERLGEAAREAASGSGVEVLELEALLGEPGPLEAPGTIPLDLAALIYTSGTTGEPKGVMMSHQAMVFTATAIAQYLEQQPSEEVLSVLPLAFTYGLYQLLVAVKLGATLALERSFTYPGELVQRLREEAPQVFAGVPTIFHTLVRLHRQKPITLPSLTRVTNAAAALPPALVPELAEIFPNARIYAMYGLTECTRVAFLDPERLRERPTSVGRAIPGTEVSVRDAAGAPVPLGVPGILHVRGPHVMLGYWNRPEKSAEMLKPGALPFERVLATGDWFRQDEEGLLYFVARSDDIIKTSGEKVSPVEVEHVLLALPGVAEAAVLGVPDDSRGALVRAYVALEPGANLSERDVRLHCARHLEPYMVPAEVRFEAELPKNASGKIHKQALRARDLPEVSAS